MDNLFHNDRSRFQRITLEKGKPKSRHCSELKVNDKIITDERELLLAWKFHFEDLYTPVNSVHYNATFKNFVEDKLLEYSAISGSVKDDILQNPFTMEEVCAVCLRALWSFRPLTVSSPTFSSPGRFVPNSFRPQNIYYFHIQVYKWYSLVRT